MPWIVTRGIDVPILCDDRLWNIDVLEKSSDTILDYPHSKTDLVLVTIPASL